MEGKRKRKEVESSELSIKEFQHLQFWYWKVVSRTAMKEINWGGGGWFLKEEGNCHKRTSKDGGTKQERLKVNTDVQLFHNQCL